MAEQSHTMMNMSSKAKPVVCPVCGGRGVSNDNVCLFCDGEGFRLGTLGYERTPEAARAEELARIAAFTLLEIACELTKQGEFWAASDKEVKRHNATLLGKILREGKATPFEFWAESVALQLFRTGTRRARSVLDTIAGGKMTCALGSIELDLNAAGFLHDIVVNKGREMRPSVFEDCNPDRLT